jgi:hypothetical protein
MILESLEVVIPEPLIMRDPVPYRAESFGDEVVAAFAAVPLFGHESGIKQDAEVLGDGRAAHPEVSRNRVHGAIVLDEQIQHPAPRRMTDRPEDGLLAIGSPHHGANIRKE